MKKERKEILIEKASGELAPFSRKKLESSLRNAGASRSAAQEIAQMIEAELYNGISTKKIYGKAFSLLRKRSRPTAGRYKLKRAIMELGPTGFPFEIFVAEILKAQGFGVEVGKIVQGKCVSHEIDVAALDDDRHYMVECKFHNRQGFKSDVKVALYIHARFQDVERNWKKLPGHGEKFHQAWVVTNTRFTEDALRYGNCVGMRLLGWDYPEDDSLKKIIDRLGLHPITCMTTLRKKEKEKLLEAGIVMCKHLCDSPKSLTEIGVSANRVKSILEEGAEMCGIAQEKSKTKSV